MTGEFKLTLDIAQILLLGGLVWGLARMSKSVDVLTDVTDRLTEGVRAVEQALGGIAGRVLVLEERTGPGRRASDRE